MLLCLLIQVVDFLSRNNICLHGQIEWGKTGLEEKEKTQGDFIKANHINL